MIERKSKNSNKGQNPWVIVRMKFFLLNLMFLAIKLVNIIQIEVK